MEKRQIEMKGSAFMIENDSNNRIVELSEDDLDQVIGGISYSGAATNLLYSGGKIGNTNLNMTNADKTKTNVLLTEQGYNPSNKGSKKGIDTQMFKC